MKNKRNVIYALILPLLVVSGLVFANREIKNGTPEKTSPKPSSIADKKAGREARNIWENSPDGIKFKLWENSPEGKKVNASHDKIRKNLKDFTNMEAVVTSVSLPPKVDGTSGPLGLMVRINGEEYMMQFGYKEFQKLNSLKVNDKIVVKSHSAGRSPNHRYLVVSGDIIEQNGKVLFKREFNQNGC